MAPKVAINAAFTILFKEKAIRMLKRGAGVLVVVRLNKLQLSCSYRKSSRVYYLHHPNRLP
jgi:hypothetical protein